MFYRTPHQESINGHIIFYSMIFVAMSHVRMGLSNRLSNRLPVRHTFFCFCNFRHNGLLRHCHLVCNLIIIHLISWLIDSCTSCFFCLPMEFHRNCQLYGVSTFLFLKNWCCLPLSCAMQMTPGIS